MRKLLVVAFMVFASVAMAEDKRRDDDLNRFGRTRKRLK